MPLFVRDLIFEPHRRIFDDSAHLFYNVRLVRPRWAVPSRDRHIHAGAAKTKSRAHVSGRSRGSNTGCMRWWRPAASSIALPGQSIDVEKLPVAVGEQITLDRVLLVADGDQITVGRPLVTGAHDRRDRRAPGQAAQDHLLPLCAEEAPAQKARPSPTVHPAADRIHEPRLSPGWNGLSPLTGQEILKWLTKVAAPAATVVTAPVSAWASSGSAGSMCCPAVSSSASMAPGFHPGVNVILGKDFTLFATAEGFVKFETKNGRSLVSVYPEA